MDSVSMFVKTVIIISFMWCVAEAVLPESSVRKYSSFIYGLIIISLMLSTVTELNFDKLKVYSDNTQISESNEIYIKELYENKISELLTEKFGDKSIKVELTDDYKIKKILCNDKQTGEEIMRYLNE